MSLLCCKAVNYRACNVISIAKHANFATWHSEAMPSMFCLSVLDWILFAPVHGTAHYDQCPILWWSNVATPIQKGKMWNILSGLRYRFMKEWTDEWGSGMDSTFILPFIADVITYPCWDWSWSMLVKFLPCGRVVHNITWWSLYYCQWHDDVICFSFECSKTKYSDGRNYFVIFRRLQNDIEITSWKLLFTNRSNCI